MKKPPKRVWVSWCPESGSVGGAAVDKQRISICYHGGNPVGHSLRQVAYVLATSKPARRRKP